MTDNINTRRSQNPQWGGNLGTAPIDPLQGWPDNMTLEVAGGWWARRVKPYHSNYQGMWNSYLGRGLVVELDASILADANAHWHAVDESYDHGDLTEDTPWTLLDSNGKAVDLFAVPRSKVAAPLYDVARSYAAGWVLHHYWQLDLGKMVRRIASKLQET